MSHSAPPQGSRKPQKPLLPFPSIFLYFEFWEPRSVSQFTPAGVFGQALTVRFNWWALSALPHTLVVLCLVLTHLIMCTFNAHHLIAVCTPDMQGFTSALAAIATLLLVLRPLVFFLSLVYSNQNNGSLPWGYGAHQLNWSCAINSCNRSCASDRSNEFKATFRHALRWGRFFPEIVRRGCVWGHKCPEVLSCQILVGFRGNVQGIPCENTAGAFTASV